LEPLQSAIRLAAGGTRHEKETIQRQIDATYRQIDLLVHELYDLTQEEEIEIVVRGNE
jgi:hypothetical protein